MNIEDSPEPLLWKLAQLDEWLDGLSGEAAAEVQRLARAHAPEAIRFLLDVVADRSAAPEDRENALRTLQRHGILPSTPPNPT